VLARRIMGRSLNTATRISLGIANRTASMAEKYNIPAPPPEPFPENAKFKDAHLGRRAFVIGNGPSVALQDLSPLKGELLFTMNAFDRHPLCKVLRPTYHFIADPLGNTNDPAVESMLARIADGIGDSPVFIPAWSSIESATLQHWRAAGQLWTVPMYGALAEGPVEIFDMVTGLPGVQSTSQLAIMAAVYMGCNPIYLTGLDSDWAASPNLDRHFYSQATIDWEQTERDPARLSYQTILECTLSLWKGYSNLWDYCISRRVEVYNCTAGGLLDVFPRRHLEEVVGP